MATVTTATTIGGGNQSSGGTTFITVTFANAVAAGDAILIFTETGSLANVVNSITDTKGNLYSRLAPAVGTTQSFEVWGCFNAKACTTSDTWTVNYSTSGSIQVCIGCTVHGLAGFDSTAGFGYTSGTSTSASRSTGVLAQASEMVFGIFDCANAGTSLTVSGLTSIGTQHPASNRFMTVGWKVVSATTSTACSATVGTSAGWGASTIAFRSGFGLDALVSDSSVLHIGDLTGTLISNSIVAGSSATDPLMATSGSVSPAGKSVQGLADGTVAMATSGTLAQISLIAGSSATASAASGQALFLVNSISGTSVAVMAANGTLSMRGIVAGSSATVPGASGSLTLVGKVTGTAAAVSATSGTLISTSVISGTSATVSSTSGALPSISYIFSAAGAVTVSHANGALKLIGAIYGVSITVSVTSAPAILKQISKVTGVSVTTSASFGQFVPLTLVPIPPPGSDIPVPISAQWLNSSLVPQGLIPYNTLNAVLYYNAVGTWSMTVPYSDQMWQMIQSGDFIVHVDWKGLFSFGGKCEVPGYDDTVPGTTGGAAGAVGSFITLAGADYKALIANRIAYPAPASAWSAQLATSADAVGPTPLETAIKHYISVNMGAAAIAARRLAFLDIATDTGRGDSIKYSAKFQQGVSLNLMDVIRSMVASAVNPMGISLTLQPNYRLLFDCYVPRNLTNQAWFSKSLGNLTAVSMTSPDPTVTDALVQGSASFVERTAAGITPWTRIEDFIDQTSETDATLIQQAGDGALGGGAAGPTLSVTIADLPFLTFGRDYQLGDMVTVEVRPGVYYQDVISSVSLTVDPAQTPSVQVVPQVGFTSDATGANQSYVAQLSARVRYLEQRLNVASK